MPYVRMILVEENEARQRTLESLLARVGARVESRTSFAGISLPAGGAEEFLILAVSIPDARSRLLGSLGAFKQEHPEVPVIALSPAEAAPGIVAFIEHGLIDQVSAPDNLAGILAAVKNERLKSELTRKAAAFLKDIHRLKKEHTTDLRRAIELEEMYETTLENFMAALDLRDVETYGHSKTVARYSHVLAEAMGVGDPKTLDNIRKGALLHDAGKIAIPDSILKKPGPLTDAEWAKIKRHPALGYGLIKDIKLVKEVGNIILYHHERYDGAGYPKGLKGNAIPLEARIFAVADTLDAVTSHRPYRGRRDFGTAKKEIIENAGTQFDPAVVDGFCSMDLAVWERVQYETTRIMPSVEAYRHLATFK